ncbi:6-phosphogluconolactonase [Chryseolinea lacunae]|uniref:6-phosphogluconolactonase n=1 Tax=Chryseolinea lacunae TaxID=2801331 RepID=A0ABS1KMY7_9BACT|nr:6-phosphogluconolactonase [Chryseolinea lacunae]MBL0740032.1 6-phosphogluconolactonase [Chryseolinea lacunae]
MKMHISKTQEEVIVALADFMVNEANQSIAKHGRFSVVLSGGSSPKKLFETLASPGYRERIAWPQWFFFFGDERYVPATHADSNYRMAKETLLDPMNITPGQVFRMNTDLTPPEAASAYETDLLAYFGDKPVRFDLILLGLGDDAHTASLFPHTPVLHEKEALVKEVFVPKVSAFRITLTTRSINCAANVAFLTFGASKASAVHHVLKGVRNIEEYPAQLIKPEDGTLHWFIDEAAAAQIEN